MRKGCVCADKPTQIPTSTFNTLCEWVGDPFRSRAACLDLLCGEGVCCVSKTKIAMETEKRRSQWRPKSAMETEKRRSQWRPKSAMETEKQDHNGNRG